MKKKERKKCKNKLYLVIALVDRYRIVVIVHWTILAGAGYCDRFARCTITTAKTQL